MNPFIEQLKKYGHLTAETEEEVNGKIKILRKEKGDFLLKKGQIISNLFVIEKGAVRSYYQTDQKEINLWFGFENTILGSILPLYLNRPSIENIQFLEYTILHYISHEDLESVYKTSQEMNTIGRKIAEEYCTVLEERSFILQTQIAEQRYRWFLKNQPEALQRVSLGHISSYLGISQETLSRIRKK